MNWPWFVLPKFPLIWCFSSVSRVWVTCPMSVLLTNPSGLELLVWSITSHLLITFCLAKNLCHISSRLHCPSLSVLIRPLLFSAWSAQNLSSNIGKITSDFALSRLVRHLAMASQKHPLRLFLVWPWSHRLVYTVRFSSKLRLQMTWWVIFLSTHHPALFTYTASFFRIALFIHTILFPHTLLFIRTLPHMVPSTLDNFSLSGNNNWCHVYSIFVV